ncbi:hypothetical protein BDV59DRAFT_181649 [Aspergillus ambiguus]|uniref:uncharacterized protein n=1 Tax=Aspergillus ambiguus TaxID=176160 RepID=UPI003CCCD97E
MRKGRRGKYSSVVCRGCRSRKIKCILPSPDDLGPLGLPQPREKSCDRCRNLHLECIVERTLLGRPAVNQRVRSGFHNDRLCAPTPSATEEPQRTSTFDGTEIKSHLYGDLADGPSIFDQDAQPKGLTPENKKAIFLSMIDPLHFFSSILANDRTFGANIPRLSTRWDTSLPDLISSDLARALDGRLAWHRFFLPHVPTIASLRVRLQTGNDDGSHATALLFSLLCLTALEMTQDVSREQPHLKRDLQLAISYYGQEFLFCPPIHPDSVAVALFLTEYQPTAVATSQPVVHKSVKSETYIILAHRIAEQLGILPTQCCLDYDFHATEDPDFGEQLLSFIQGPQVYCYEASLGGFVMKPVRVAQATVDCLKSHIGDFQSLLSQRQCTPTMVYHIHSIMGTYMHMKATINLKENWSDSARIFMITDQLEKDYLELKKTTSSFPFPYAAQDEISAACSLLEMQFQSQFINICGLALVYATSVRARAQNGNARKDQELNHDEAIQISTQVIQCMTNLADETDLRLFPVLQRFGVPYPSYLKDTVAMFIENARKLTLDDVPFRPPTRLLVTEIVRHCKNLVENNSIQLKGFGKLHSEFEEQLAVFKECVQLLEKMKSSPWNSVNTAFADGCVCAASAKVIEGFITVMDRFKSLATAGINVTGQSHLPGVPSDFDTSQELGLDFSLQEWAWLWPSTGEADYMDILQQSEWFSGIFPLEDSLGEAV